MITVTKLSKIFGQGATEVKAVDDTSFSLRSGTLAAIVGKSGSGKSTLLALLGALDAPTDGTIEVDQKKSHRFTRERFIELSSLNDWFCFSKLQPHPESLGSR